MYMSNIYNDEKFFKEYAKMSRSQYGLEGAGEWHQFKSFFEDLTNNNVLDLGCGYGWHSKYCIDQGAKHVYAIDLSAKMIEKAKQINSHSQISYHVMNICDYAYPEQQYDLVISNLVLHYIENLTDIYEKVFCTLKVNGTFIFNIEHPTFTAGINQDFIYDEKGAIKYYPIDNYYFSGKRETLFLGQPVKKYHHTLTQIINELIVCGFKIERIEEAIPEKDAPWYESEMKRPMMLLVKAKKIG